MEIRDPIHGFIHNSAMTQAIIDTHIFQRLRRIKQLAMAFLVYPGALHTRFEHSLGVMHIAGQLHDRLVNDPDEAELVRAAALLHDIGHGPFSHVSECVFEQLAAPGGVQHELEHRLAEVLGIMPHAVIAYVYQESRNPEASVVVDLQAAGTALFEELSKLFVSIEDQQWLDVYAPVDFRDASERERAMKKWAEEIPGVVESMTTASGKEG